VATSWRTSARRECLSYGNLHPRLYTPLPHPPYPPRSWFTPSVIQFVPGPTRPCRLRRHWESRLPGYISRGARRSSGAFGGNGNNVGQGAYKSYSWSSVKTGGKNWHLSPERRCEECRFCNVRSAFEYQGQFSISSSLVLLNVEELKCG